MTNNAVLKTIDLSGDWQPIATASLVATVTVSCPPGNSAAAQVRTHTGSEASLQPGEWHMLHRVDLARLQAKGEAGDVLSIVGGTW